MTSRMYACRPGLRVRFHDRYPRRMLVLLFAHLLHDLLLLLFLMMKLERVEADFSRFLFLTSTASGTLFCPPLVHVDCRNAQIVAPLVGCFISICCIFGPRLFGFLAEGDTLHTSCRTALEVALHLQRPT